MVNSISFSGYNIGQYSQKDIENITKFALGTNIVNEQDSPLAGMGFLVGIGGIMEAVKGIGWLRRPGTFVEKWDKFVEESKKESEIFRNGGWKTAKPYQNSLHNYYASTFTDMIPTGEKLKRLSQGTQDLYKQAEAKLKEAASNPEKIKEANSLLARANAAAAQELPKLATGTFGKLWQGFKNITGISWINKKLAEYAVGSPLVEKFLRYGKGWGLFAGFQAGVELFTQVIPAFKENGLGSGIAQIFKSLSNCVTSVLGWTLGFAGGSAGGAVLGATIGSIFPGVGTVIGGLIGSLCGFAGGCAGSWALMKVSEKILGKSEIEEKKEREAIMAASQAQSNPQKLQEIAAQAQEKLNEDSKSEDAKIVFGSLQRLGLVVPPVERKPRLKGSSNNDLDASEQPVGNSFNKFA